MCSTGDAQQQQLRLQLTKVYHKHKCKFKSKHELKTPGKFYCKWNDYNKGDKYTRLQVHLPMLYWDYEKQRLQLVKPKTEFKPKTAVRRHQDLY